MHSFGSIENLKKEFLEKSMAVFGSGWVWFIENHEGKIEITSTTNANSPLIKESNLY